MKQPDAFNRYIDEVCGQVRCKKARPDIAGELAAHMDDQQAAYEVMGLSETEARRETVRQMGDPVTVGMALDRTHRPMPDIATLLAVMALVLLGVYLQSIVLGGSWSEYHYLPHFAEAAAVGAAVMAAAYLLDFTLLAKYPLRFYLIAALFFFLWPAVAFPAHQPWFTGYFGYTLLLFVPLYCGVIYAFKDKGRRGVLCCGLLALLPSGLAFLQPAPTAMLILGGSCCTVLCAAVLRGWFGRQDKYAFLLAVIPLVGAAVLFAVLLWWQSLLNAATATGIMPGDSRAIFLDSIMRYNTVSHTGMNAELNWENIQDVFANARLAGQMSVPPSGMQPGNINFFQSDFMLLYIIAKYGWGPGLLVIGGIVALVARMFTLAFRQRNRLAFFVLLGISSVFAIQSAIFFLTNFGILTIRSFSLPLVLCTGWGLVVSMCLIGLFLSVYKYKGIISERAMRKAAG